MTSNHHAPYDLGYTRATMVGTKRSEAVTWSKPHKANLSSDCRLQLAYMKLESLVIANQNVAVNTFPGTRLRSVVWLVTRFHYLHQLFLITVLLVTVREHFV